MIKQDVYRGLTYSIAFSLVLLLIFGVVFAENDGGSKKNENNKNYFSSVRKEDREEWKIPGGEPRVEISPSGNVLVRGAKITAISGNEIKANVSFGAPDIDWVVRTGTSTQFVRRLGGNGNIGEFSVGDVISFSGSLVDNTSPLTVDAKTVKNWSIQKISTSMAGTVSGVDAGAQKFMMSTKKNGVVTVLTSTSTTFRKNGNATTTVFADITVNDRVEVKGLYNNLTKILTADKVYILKKEPVKPPKTFEGGTLKSVSASTTPATIVVNFNNTDYSVSVDADTLLLNNLWAKINLSDIRTGDKIRVYGAEYVASSTVIEATVVRDTSIPR